MTALTRRERHEELIKYAIDGAVAQVQRAYEMASGKGAININVLWEMGGAQRVLHGVLERTKGLVTGVTCGAGHAVQAQRDRGVLRRQLSADHQLRARLQRACGSAPITRPRNGLRRWSTRTRGWPAGTTACRNAEDPRAPQDPYPRVAALRATMRENGIADSVPIVMAGGVWRLDEWENWIDNPELGQIVFQFGTRPLLTQESPIPPEWKARLMTLEEGDVLLHRFSPTGFYSSAVRNPFLRNLEARSERQIAFTKEPIGDHHFELDVGIGTKRNYWVTKGDLQHAREWFAAGFTKAMKTPDETLIFVDARGGEADPRRPGRMHGLPQPVRFLVLGGQ